MKKGKIGVLMLGLRAIAGAQGGIESHVREIASEIAGTYRDDFEVEVLERSRYVNPSRSLSSDLQRVKLTQIWSPASAHLETIVHTFFCVMYAGIRRPSIVHIHGIGPALLAPLAKLLLLKVVVTHHGEDYSREKWGPFARFTLRLGEFCAAYFSDERIVIAPSLDVKLARKYSRMFAYIPNAVPAMKQHISSDKLDEFQVSARRYFLHVGRVVAEKRQLDLIAAFIAVAPVDWNLVLVGGMDHDSSYAKAVSAAAAQDSRIKMTGALQGDALNALFVHAAAFVLPSSHEGLPIALLEAMSCHLPVIVTTLPTLVALQLPESCYVPVATPGPLEISLRNEIALERKGGRRIDWKSHLMNYSIGEVGLNTVKIYRSVVQQ